MLFFTFLSLYYIHCKRHTDNYFFPYFLVCDSRFDLKRFFFRYQDLKITTIDSFVATARKTDKAWTSIKDLFVVIVVKKFLLISFKWSCQISELESFFFSFTRWVRLNIYLYMFIEVSYCWLFCNLDVIFWLILCACASNNIEYYDHYHKI